MPPDIQELEGQQIFIKGFMRPGTHVSSTGTPVRRNVSRFLLVRDSNECCFGDISTVKHYDKVNPEKHSEEVLADLKDFQAQDG